MLKGVETVTIETLRLSASIYDKDTLRSYKFKLELLPRFKHSVGLIFVYTKFLSYWHESVIPLWFGYSRDEYNYREGRVLKDVNKCKPITKWRK